MPRKPLLPLLTLHPSKLPHHRQEKGFPVFLMDCGSMVLILSIFFKPFMHSYIESDGGDDPFLQNAPFVRDIICLFSNLPV